MPEAKKPQDRRPPARRETATTAKRRNQVLDEEFTLRIDGVDYTIVPADFSGRLERKVRAETGMSVLGIINALDGGQTGIDLLGMFMWAVRIGRGEEVELDDILDSISYASEVEVVGEGDKRGDDSPEA